MRQFGIIKKCLDTVDARYKHEDYNSQLKYVVKDGSAVWLPAATQPILTDYYNFSKAQMKSSLMMVV